MSGIEDMRQQMRRMQDDVLRLAMRPFGATDSFFNLERDPFVPALTFPSGSCNRDLAISHMPTGLDVYKPQMDVLDMGDHFSVRADLPGMQKQDVKVEVKDGVLNVCAEHKEDKKRTEGNWVVQERRFGKFQRTLKLPGNVKEDAIKANFNDGVLEVNLPKQENTVAKSITIS